MPARRSTRQSRSPERLNPRTGRSRSPCQEAWSNSISNKSKSADLSASAAAHALKGTLVCPRDVAAAKKAATLKRKRAAAKRGRSRSASRSGAKKAGGSRSRSRSRSASRSGAKKAGGSRSRSRSRSPCQEAWSATVSRRSHMGSPDPLSAAEAAEELKGTFSCDLPAKRKVAPKRKAAAKRKAATKRKVAAKRARSRSRSRSPAKKARKTAVSKTKGGKAKAKGENTWSLALKAVPLGPRECYVPREGTARHAAVKAKQAQLEKAQK